MPISASAVARVVGIDTIYKDLRAGGAVALPQRIAVIAQGSDAAAYPASKQQVTNAVQAGSLYGFGSPIHLAVLQLLPTNGDGVGSIPVTVYPLDAAGGATVSTGDITPTGATTIATEFRVTIGGVLSAPIVISAGIAIASVTPIIAAAINSISEMPVIATSSATDVEIVSKWKGASANGIKIRVDGPTDSGMTFAITQPVGGAANPDVTTALDLVGDVWETMFLNCFNDDDAVTMNAFAEFGEGRWGELTKKPMLAFFGSTASTVTAATAVTDVRTTDRTNVQLIAPGSAELPFVVAARQLARIAIVADSNPARSYGGQPVTGIEPGDDSVQWDYAQRNLAVTSGASTTSVRSNVVTIEDVVTMYHPEGDPLPAYRKVVNIVKLQNIIFNVDLIFSGSDWAGSPLIPDGQATVNPDARTPRSAVVALNGLTDSLALNAIISDPEFTKTNTFASIDASNPDRLNVSITYKLSGNSDVIAITNNWGFYFGGAV